MGGGPFDQAQDRRRLISNGVKWSVFIELFNDFHNLGEAPFERGEDPELEVVDAHLAVNEVNDFYRECDGGQLNHEQAHPIGGEN